MTDYREPLYPRDPDCMPLAPFSDLLACPFWLRAAVYFALGMLLEWSVAG